MRQALNTLYLSTEGSYARLEGETLVLMVEKEKKGQVPLHHLGSIVCIGRINLSPQLMGRCMEDGRSIVWLNPNGRFRARVEGPVNGNILLRQAQHRIADNPELALSIAKGFIAGKIRNSRSSLQRSARDSKHEQEIETLNHAIQSLASSLRNTEHAKNAASLLGIEGDAASTYFSQFNQMLKADMREDFGFTTRSRRPPKDPINALISFLYAMLLNDCRSALETVGLDPQLGFFHTVRPGRASLALDLQEEFRPILADRLGITLINRGQIKARHFDHHPGGAVSLNDDGRKNVIVAFQERKRETLTHPVLEQKMEIGLLPLIQARLLARHLRGDLESYVPYLHS